MLWSGFILGLLGSLHCVGMCGPIAFMLPVDRTNSTTKVFQIGLYHFGRLLAYALIGLAFGLIGKSLYIFGHQQQLSIIIGAVMILMVVLPHKIISRFSFTKPIYSATSKLKSKLGVQFKKKTPDTFLTIGFLNGFLPCGLVYMAVIGSVALGGALKGSAYMLLFGLGTMPLMTSAIYLGRFLNSKIKHQISKLVPVFVVVIGVLFILRGLGLGIPFISPEPVVEMVSNTMNCH